MVGRENLLEEVGFACNVEDGREKNEAFGFRDHGGLNPVCPGMTCSLRMEDKEGTGKPWEDSVQ